MSKLLLAVILLLIPLLALATEDISDSDLATYDLTLQDGQPMDMKMRLVKVNGKWSLEGKKGVALLCKSECEYRTSTNAEAETFLTSLPPEMQGQYQIACIQNSTYAFCKLSNEDRSSQAVYALVVVATGKPVPLILRRLN